MTTIVLNTATGAVTEFDWAFVSISQDRAADETNLYALGGDTDAGAPITGELQGGNPGGERLQTPGNVFLAVHGEGNGVLIVRGRSDSWEYPVLPRPSGVSCAKPGKGISESYLGFGYRNVAGAAFRLDRIDAEVTQTNSRRN